MKIIKLFFTAIIMMAMIVACQEELPELGEPIPVEDLEFRITQNPSDPNMVILESMTPGVIPQWSHPMGRSTNVRDTVKLPFAGTYHFIYSVLGAGGYTSADTVTLEITTQNLTYLADPLWDALSGGVGNEKSWVLDIEGKYFAGAMSFFGTNNGWLAGGNEWSGGETGCYGGDCWTWSPDAAWLRDNALAEGDHGVMTFSLKGGAYFNAVKPQEGGIEEDGTYFLNTNTKMLRINDASILRSYKPARNGINGISDWTNYVLFDLNDDILRLGVVRDKDVDGEGSAMLVYNFISKEYSDNWVPEEEDDPTAPVNTAFDASTLEGLWKLSGAQTTGWVNWVDGALFQTWDTREAMMDLFAGWWSFGDPSNTEHVAAAKAGFNETMGLVTLTFASGTCTIHNAEYDHNTDVITETDYSVPYSVSAGVITFDSEVKINAINVGLSGTTMHIIDPTNGSDAGIWLGQRNDNKFESKVVHLIKQ